jgi:hypothetical protein
VAEVCVAANSGSRCGCFGFISKLCRNGGVRRRLATETFTGIFGTNAFTYHFPDGTEGGDGLDRDGLVTPQGTQDIGSGSSFTATFVFDLSKGLHFGQFGAAGGPNYFPNSTSPFVSLTISTDFDPAYTITGASSSAITSANPFDTLINVARETQHLPCPVVCSTEQIHFDIRAFLTGVPGVPTLTSENDAFTYIVKPLDEPSAFVTDGFERVDFTVRDVTYSETAVPESSTWGMMILGFAGISFLVYRRKEKPVTMAACSTIIGLI